MGRSVCAVPSSTVHMTSSAGDWLVLGLVSVSQNTHTSCVFACPRLCFAFVAEQALVDLNHNPLTSQHSHCHTHSRCLMKVAKHPRHHVRLTEEFKSDLQWWASFLPRWTGRSKMPSEAPSRVVTTDASGTWGCGAVTDSGQWC